MQPNTITIGKKPWNPQTVQLKTFSGAEELVLLDEVRSALHGKTALKRKDAMKLLRRPDLIPKGWKDYHVFFMGSRRSSGTKKKGQRIWLTHLFWSTRMEKWCVCESWYLHRNEGFSTKTGIPLID